ncbi:hepatoma-derived growth factor-related protein 2-like [Epinephelus fuscoguttatus]|uniref:hepatoma-derived growth factor-related protein 2-like n=1 Tax=Epinephelus fuscoguttatus TaxID=293821 RepID=UPI0020D15C76|nr:hepatoma-derived growth factor-related protein 2-like [Epinephelus fuscoguttatus]
MAEPTVYKWSDEETELLIKLRMRKEALFTGKRNASKLAWETIVQKMGLQGRLTAAQAAKKWENLKKKYKDLKAPPTGAGTDQGEEKADSWQWFPLMHEAIGSRPSVTPPALIASCTGETPTTSSTATASSLPGPPERPTLSSSSSSASSASSSSASSASSSSSPQPPPPQQPHSSPPKKRARRERLVDLILREGERDEDRFQHLEAQTDRLLNIFEKMVDKM